MNRLNRYVDSRGVAPFFGGGGGQSKKKKYLFAGLCAQRRKIENCVCLVVFDYFYVEFNGFAVPYSVFF